MKGLLSFAFLLIFPAVVFSQEPPIPKPVGFVNDFVRLLDAATKAELTRLCQEVERQTTAEIAILIVESTKPLDAFQYAVKVFDVWKIGKKGKDNGVLFLIAVKDRQLWITVGYGLEGVLPDGKVGEIRDRFVIPYFKQGNYAQGILEGTKAIAAAIRGEAFGRPAGPPRVEPAPRPSWELAPQQVVLLVLLIFGTWTIFLWYAMASQRHRRWRRRALRDAGLFWTGGGGNFGGGGFSSGNFGGFGGGSHGGGGAGGSW